MWKFIAWAISRDIIADMLIRISKRTPYKHIMSQDGKTMYMGRWWLFNPYSRTDNKPKYWWCPWSIRIHHILRHDTDRDLHDHPWNARTIILRGWYKEERECEPGPEVGLFVQTPLYVSTRHRGDTATLGFNEYHRISHVSPGGVYTLFISGPWMGVWGFKVNGVKVGWKKYLGIPEDGDLP